MDSGRHRLEHGDLILLLQVSTYQVQGLKKIYRQSRRQGAPQAPLGACNSFCFRWFSLLTKSEWRKKGFSPSETCAMPGAPKIAPVSRGYKLMHSWEGGVKNTPNAKDRSALN